MYFFILIFVVAILLLPLLFWMYIFTAFFTQSIKRSQFMFGVFVGALMSLPLIYQNYSFFGDLLTQVFYHLSDMGESFFSFGILLFLTGFFFIFWICFYFFEKISYPKGRIILKKYLVSFGFYFFLLFIGVVSMGVLSFLFPDTTPGVAAGFGGFFFYSIGTIVSYYIIISLLEEGVKYLPSLRFYPGEKNINFQGYISLCACIALGFAFFENIAYTFSYYQNNGIGLALLQLVFFRSLFSLSLHLIASILFGAAFWKLFVYLETQKTSFLPIVFLALGAIMSHTLFDTFLSFGYVGFLLIYIFFLYILISYISTNQN